MSAKRLSKAVRLQEARVALDSTALSAFGLRVEQVVNQKQQPKNAEEPAYVVLKYFDSAFECFSVWQADELRAFTEFLKKLGSMTWNVIHKNDGLKLKQLNIETVDGGASACLKRVHGQLSRDITFFELRVTQSIRVHGFRVKAAFFLVLLDREHRVYAE